MQRRTIPLLALRIGDTTVILHQRTGDKFEILVQEIMWNINSNADEDCTISSSVSILVAVIHNVTPSLGAES